MDVRTIILEGIKAPVALYNEFTVYFINMTPELEDVLIAWSSMKNIEYRTFKFEGGILLDCFPFLSTDMGWLLRTRLVPLQNKSLNYEEEYGQVSRVTTIRFEYKIDIYGIVLSDKELNKEGEQGWELCSVLKTHNPEFKESFKVHYHFKRKVIDN